MKQLNLFSADNSVESNSRDLSVFNGEILVDEEKPDNEPALKPQKITLVKNQYVRTKHSEIYHIDGISHSQKIFTGYETCKDRYGNTYRKSKYETYERAYAYVIKNGKSVKTLICQEDVVAQSPFVIDLVFKGDYIYTADNGIQRVDHKHIGKTINREVYSWDETNKCIIKELRPYPKTYVLCDNGKLLLNECEVLGLVSQKIDYTRFLEVGMKVKCAYWGWCTITKIMSGKVLCTHPRAKRPIFLYFDQIMDVKEIDNSP